MNCTEDKVKDLGINLSDFLPEPRSLSHVLRLSPTLKKSGEMLLDLNWLDYLIVKPSHRQINPYQLMKLFLPNLHSRQN